MSKPRAIRPVTAFGEYESQAWLVEVNGTRYLCEQWWASNSSGIEWYDPDTLAPVEDPTDDEEWESIEDSMRTLGGRWQTLFAERIRPLIDALDTEVYGPTD